MKKKVAILTLILGAAGWQQAGIARITEPEVYSCWCVHPILPQDRSNFCYPNDSAGNNKCKADCDVIDKAVDRSISYYENTYHLQAHLDLNKNDKTGDCTKDANGQWKYVSTAH